MVGLLSVRGLVLSVLVGLVGIIVVKVYHNYPSGRTGVIFYYCTKSHEDRRQVKATEQDVKEIPAGPETLVNVIIHGYTESSTRQWIVNLTDALLTSGDGGDGDDGGGGGDSVVILVDYWDLVTISRPYMMENVRQTADVTALFIDLLAQHRGVRLSRIHVIGFSLGGRMSGLVGRRIKTGRIGRITGLDASYPWIPTESNDEWLDASDASLVVTLRTSTIGSHSPPGHIDFIVNGGHTQPGCSHWYLPNTVEQICSHYRSVLIMVESVRAAAAAGGGDSGGGGGGVFPACRRDSSTPSHQDTSSSSSSSSCYCHVTNHFSSRLNTSVHGTFHLSTNPEPPYSKPLPPPSPQDRTC